MAPYFQQARLLIAADCVPFAYPSFHEKLLKGRALLIGCPKLDEVEFYQEKLTALFKQHEFESVDIAIMEVPCCSGLVKIVQTAISKAGKQIPVSITVLGIRGDKNPNTLNPIA